VDINNSFKSWRKIKKIPMLTDPQLKSSDRGGSAISQKTADRSAEKSMQL
jgi:hypothetical protein